MTKTLTRKIYLEDKPREIALKQILEEFQFSSEIEWISTSNARNRITAQPIFANLSMPHYHASAMDGISVVAETTYSAHEKNPLHLVEGVDFVYVDTGDPIMDPYNAVIMSGDVMIRNVSNEVVQLALQGPFSEKVLQRLSRVDLRAIPSFQFMDNVELCGVKTLISRTGYTGEDGFEIYCHKNDGILLWRKILETGKEDGVIPCGLGARDTLRFEAKLPLYGQELTDEITPIEAGLGFAVKITKEIEFIGKSVLKAQKENGTARKLVGIEMIEKGIPRNGYSVYMNNEKIGEVTTGTQSPTLKKNVGLALLDVDYSNIGTEVDVQIRNKRLKAVVIRTPFYKKRS